MGIDMLCYKKRELSNTLKRKAFSLVELAISILVIGLLITITVGGLSIQKSSEIRGMITDVQQFQLAVENFNLQYESLPGDMDNATDYWSASANGDGDDTIEYPSSGNIEALRAWQQLALAGLIEGGYTGTAGDGADQADIGINVPSSHRAKVGYNIMTGNLSGGDDRHEIRIGSFDAGEKNQNAALTPQEARSIDAKLDDGNPADGTVFGLKGTDIASELCQNASGDDYRITQDSKTCVLAFPAFP